MAAEKNKITAQEICNTAANLFKSAERCSVREGERRQHVGVDFQILKDQKESMRLIDFTERCIKPAIVALAKKVPEDVVFLDLELPLGCEMVAKADFIRFICDSHFTAVSFDEITGEPTEFDFVVTGRFDVLFELA